MAALVGDLTRIARGGGSCREHWELRGALLMRTPLDRRAAPSGAPLAVDLAEPGVDVERGYTDAHTFVLVCAGADVVMRADEQIHCDQWVSALATALLEHQPLHDSDQHTSGGAANGGGARIDRESIARHGHALAALAQETFHDAQCALQTLPAQSSAEVRRLYTDLVEARRFALTLCEEHADQTRQLFKWVGAIEAGAAEQEARIAEQANEVAHLEDDLRHAREQRGGGSAAVETAAAPNATRRIVELEQQLRAARVDVETERTRCDVLTRRVNDASVVERALALRHEVAALSARRDRALEVEATALAAAARVDGAIQKKTSERVDVEIAYEGEFFYVPLHFTRILLTI
jgi:hypothetical protein